MNQLSFLEWVRLLADAFVIPMFAVVLSGQGRLSRLEGELKALYTIIKMLTEKRNE